MENHVAKIEWLVEALRKESAPLRAKESEEFEIWLMMWADLSDQISALQDLIEQGEL